MIGVVCRRVSINRTRMRKDSAPVTAAVGGSISGRVPFAPRLLSSAVVARLRRLSSFLCTFHVAVNMNQGDLDQSATREERG